MTKTAVATANYTGLVLAVHPTLHGFGWVLFENTANPVAWAIVRNKHTHHERLLASFRRLLAHYEPAVLVLEVFDSGESRRSARIQSLCRAMLREAEVRKIERRVFERETIRAAFARFGAMTRSEIASVIAQRVDSFAHRLPPRRRIWNSQDARQSLFDAAALAVTYYAAMDDFDLSA